MTNKPIGRPRGSRNLLTRQFVGALVEEFEEGGKEALRIVRIEDPATFLKLCATVIPKEFDVSVAAHLDDTELQNALDTVRRLMQGEPPMLIDATPIKVTNDDDC